MERDLLRVNWKWFVLFGCVSIGLGVLAVTLPNVFAVGLDVIIGLVLLGNGIFQAVETFKGHESKDFFLSMGTAIVEVGVGGWMLLHPIQGGDLLALIIAVVFLFEGVFKFYWANRIRPDATWQWLAINGVIALIFAALIGFQIFGSDQKIAGLLVGLNLFANGITLFIVGIMNRAPGLRGGGEVSVPLPGSEDEGEEKEEPEAKEGAGSPAKNEAPAQNQAPPPTPT